MSLLLVRKGNHIMNQALSQLDGNQNLFNVNNGKSVGGREGKLNF